MKRILSLTMALVLSVSLFAQNADFQKSVAKYKNISSLTATATRITHKSGSSADKSVSGTLYVKRPSKVLIANGKDALLMNGSNFTMKKGVLKAKTDSNKDNQYKTFHDVLESIFTGGAVDISKRPDVKITKSGASVIITITPVPESKKKMMFSAFVLTIDAKSQELRSIRLQQKAGAYTEYVFSNYKLGANVADAQFK